jgi:alpha-1,3-glucan synthase
VSPTVPQSDALDADTVIHSGRGRTPTQRPSSFALAANVTAADNEHFLRDKGHNGLDSVAFHYSIYRSISRFLGMDGNLQVAYDVPVDFTEAWQEMFVTNDFLNWDSGEVDPTHMLGTSNFDIFRWPSLEAGVLKSASATFITNLVVPGVPLVSSW